MATSPLHPHPRPTGQVVPARVLSTLVAPSRGGLALLVLALVVLSACEFDAPTAEESAPRAELHLHHGPHGSENPMDVAPQNRRDLAVIREGTARYQDFDRALEDGFVPLSPCVASPVGGMGYHFGHPGRLGNLELVPGEPEILLYEPMANGRMRLVGVEYAIPAPPWDAMHDGPPVVAGRAFDPPNPDHPDPAIRELYTLHVWAWRENPLGVFAPYNPRVSCEAAL